MIRLKGSLATNVGNVREVNQDKGYVSDMVFVVADGMGGHRGGEVASMLAISKFEETEFPVDSDVFIELVQSANSLVYDRSSDEELHGMGTTLVAISVDQENQVAVFNVGDSRAYWLRDGHLAQITKDHSFVGDLVEQNEITPEEAINHPKRNVITRALGIADSIEVDRFPLTVRGGDRFLLCSDGLTDEVTEGEITDILIAQQSSQSAADTLVELALANGGRDNVTAIVIDAYDNSTEVDGGLAPTNTEEELEVDEVVEQNEEDSVAEVDQVEEESNQLEEELDESVSDSSDLESSGSKGKSILPLLFSSIFFVALLVGGYFWAKYYAQNSWYISDEDGEVAIYQGRPDGFLWFDPQVEKKYPEIDIELLPAEFQEDISDKSTFDSFKQAETKLLEIEEKILKTNRQVECSELVDENCGTNQVSNKPPIADETVEEPPIVAGGNIQNLDSGVGELDTRDRNEVRDSLIQRSNETLDPSSGTVSKE